MPKIQTSAQRRYRYEIIAKAEGEQCIACKIEKGIRRGPPKSRLVIEHADNDQKNWEWSNLHLACYRHNSQFSLMPAKAKLLQLQAYGDQLERERERENLPTWATTLKDELPYEDGSAEMRANRIYEKRWLRYVHKVLRRDSQAFKKEIIASAAKRAGCSKQTSTNYYEVNTSSEGPFRETNDADGNRIICYRDVLKKETR